jgi:hypothetical protein
LRRSCGWSAKLGQALGDGIGVREPRLRARSHERNNAGGQGCPQRLRFDRANVGSLEPGQGRCCKVVVAARLDRGQPLAEAEQRQPVVAHRANVMLRLPQAPALDARACVERVDDAPPEQVPRDRWRGNEQPPATGGVEPSAWPAAVAPNSSRNRGPAGRNCAAGVIDRSTCSASGNRNTR